MRAIYQRIRLQNRVDVYRGAGVELKKRAGCGEVTYLNFVQLCPPLAFVHGHAAEHQVTGTAGHRPTVARLVDVKNVHKKGG